eukprot:TRINITY_DN2185_c0_g1_i1.p1 TRINITY_DN2185_c0_g1~~TRINITY_DN2185_c0_g1_i1.p1  ORF type:complete len:240 (-),score=77.27 TRINITY_DN2185_c0_g1_i1:83-802(-)
MASFFSSLTSKITETVTTVASKLKPPETLPPWKYLPDGVKDQEEVVKNQILMLSKDKWSFLQSPPKEALETFEFDYERTKPIARAAMTNDSFLSSLHYFLVPDQAQDEVFWRNYFAHIHVIFKSLGAGGWKTPPEPEPEQPKQPQQQPQPQQPPSNTQQTSTSGSSSNNSNSNSSSTTTATAPTDDTQLVDNGAGVGGIELSPEELALLEEASDVTDMIDDVNFDELQEEIGKALEDQI